MTVYRKLKELPDVVKMNDRVVICNWYLYVGEDNLFSLNTEIKIGNLFKKLLIWNPEKFCEKFYGYETKGYHAFPCCKDGDYAALTKVIRALMDRDENPPLILMIYRWSKKKKKKKKEKNL